VLITGVDPARSSDLQELWPGNALVQAFDPAQAIEGIRYVTKDVLRGAEPMLGGALFPGTRP
jgi:hypothetical protein